jgi:hypothetical protein
MAAAQRLCPDAGRVPFSDAPAAAWSHESPPQQQDAQGWRLAATDDGAERPIGAANDVPFFGLGPPANRVAHGGAQQSSALKDAQRFALPGSLGSSGEIAGPLGGHGHDPSSSPLAPASEASVDERPSDAQQPQGGGRGRGQHAPQKGTIASAAQGVQEDARSTAAAAATAGVQKTAQTAASYVSVFGPKLPPLTPAECNRADAPFPRPDAIAPQNPCAVPLRMQQHRWVSKSEARPPPGAAQPTPARVDAQQRAIEELHVGLQQRRETDALVTLFILISCRC